MDLSVINPLCISCAHLTTTPPFDLKQWFALVDSFISTLGAMMF
jgi:hypothetical protein